MRLFALLGQLFVALVSGATLGWWASTRGVRLLARWAERYPPLRSGSLAAGLALLLGMAAGLTLVVGLLSFLAYWLLLPVMDWTGSYQPWLPRVWTWLVWLAGCLAAGATAFGALGAALGAFGAAQRRRHLLDGPAVPGAPDGPPPMRGGRSIVILCDGTGNRPDETEDGESSATNIWRLHNGLVCDEAQVVWYQAGVGSGTSSTDQEARRARAVLAAVGANAGAQAFAAGRRIGILVGLALGTGISEEITNGYAALVRAYRPGDRIYLVGFSRGAYTARCIAGVISSIGLLRAENVRYAADMVRIYRTRRSQKEYLPARADLVHKDPEVEFVGAFDTVASLGVPLWGWWFRVVPIWKNVALASDPAPACRHIYHALSMDERRSQFFPTLYARPTDPGRIARSRLETLEQVWFRGCHSDIGGGYARRDHSDVSLRWMMAAMARHGLRFHKAAWTELRPNVFAPLHDELDRKPAWRLFGSWPRWHPVPDARGGDPDGTVLHGSVLDRAAAMQGRAGRPDLVHVRPGERVATEVAARRDWERTGIAIEEGGLYRLTYTAGQWRDAEQPPCGPGGQRAHGAFDLRRWLEQGRRLRREDWMCLVATVAHPRRWPLEERGFRDLLKLLFLNDPKELTGQLLPIGRRLRNPGDAVLLRNLAPSGLLYLFANDWYQTASNNSGAVFLTVERLPDDCADPADYVVPRPAPDLPPAISAAMP